MECNQKFESVEALPRLPPIMHPLPEKLIRQHPALITELVHGLGPTLHVVLPQVFDETVKQFQKVLRMAGVDGFILFAKKANKARCFIQRCPDRISVLPVLQNLTTCCSSRCDSNAWSR